MKSTLEPVEGNKVKLSIAVDEAEFEKDIDEAFKRIAREVRLPGFRPGKAPRKVLEARIGPEAARSEAFEQAVPKYYLEAVLEHDVDVIAPPEFDITAGQERRRRVRRGRRGPAADHRRRVRLAAHHHPSPDVDRAEIDERIDRLRESFAELETVERPAQTGDNVTIDIAGTQAGEARTASPPTTTSTRSAAAPSSPSSTSSCGARRWATSSSSPPTTRCPTRTRSTSGSS